MGEAESKELTKDDTEAIILNEASSSHWQDYFEWSRSVQSVAGGLFGIQRFRVHQLEVINATMSSKDVFVVMRSGGGKSACFQIPGFVQVFYPLFF